MHKWLLTLALSSASAWAFDWTPTFEGFAVGGANGARSTLLNPGNVVLAVPDWTAGVDLRPALDVRYGEHWRAIARPRYFGGVNHVSRLGVAEDLTYSKFRFDEVYARWEANGWFNLSAGVINFQWGPAELLGPSNPIVHFKPDQRSLLFRQRGKVMARAVVSFDADTTAVLLVEPLSNGEESWVAQQDFTPRALLKLEQRFKNAADYLGLTAGRMEQGQLFFGQYGNRYLSDAVSVYVDARESLGSLGYYPSNGTLAQSRIDDNKPYLLGTAGLRYEGEADVRLEYIYNAFGLTGDELATLPGILGANPSLLPRALQSGRELNQKHYLYASLRYDKLGAGDTLRLALRYLFVPSDRSGSLLATAEWAFSDNCTLLLQPVLYHGDATSEFAQGASYELLGGLRAAF